MSYRQLRKCAVALLFVLMCNPAFAEVFRHGAVYFLGENNGGEGNWSQLKFRIQNPMVNGRKYLNRSSIEFTIDTNLENKAWYRTDIRFRSDWLSPRAYGTKFNDVYMGSKTINRSERAILAALSDPEISVLSWIITRSDELINEAVSHSNKPMPKFSSEKWLSLLRNQKFERRLRANFERIPSIKRNIGLHDRASVHSKFQLENEIQPALSTLGFYSGKIDGIWGPRTLLAIKSFERSQGFFPDGVVRNMKERNRLKSVLQASVTKASNTSALERVSIKAYSAGTLPKMEIMAIHQPNDKRPSEVQDIISVINLITKKIGSFKINGYLQRRSNYISANEICLYNDGWRQTTDNVCLSVTNPGSAYKVLSAHLSRISKAEIPYLKNKCQIIIKRYREILVASRGNDLVYRLLKAERPKFIEAANKCVELIDTFVTESGSQSEALAGSINTSNFSESKIRVRYSSIYIKTNDG
ncbi:MAG: peptidoglycan-binding domain-containing protein, partial [Amylibacter sp.]